MSLLFLWYGLILISLYHLQTRISMTKRNRKHLPLWRKGSRCQTLPNKKTRVMAQLENQTSCLSSLPLSLWYYWQLSAWYLNTLHWSHTGAHLTFPLCLSHPVTCYQFFTARYTWHAHITDTHGRFPHTHMRSCTDNVCERRWAETEGRFFRSCWCYFLTYHCLSGAVICAWFVSHSIVWRFSI